MKSEIKDKNQSNRNSKNEEVNIPGPNELPDQQKVGEPGTEKDSRQSGQQVTKKCGK